MTDHMKDFAKDLEEQAPEIGRAIDARLAAWISSAPACAARRYLYSGAALPEPEERPPGEGFDWQDRATVTVLRECYRRALRDPTLERVEAAALAVMPEPDDEDEDTSLPAFFRGPSPKERWERSLSATAARVSRLLRYGPTSAMSGGQFVFAGDLEAEVSGLRLRQRVDLLWRHPDGSLEAVLVFGEAHSGEAHPGEAQDGAPPVEEDWRSILTAALVGAIYGAIPQIQVVRVAVGVAQTVVYSPEHIEQRISELAEAALSAREPRTCSGTVAYPLVAEAIEPLRRGEWPRRRRPYPPGLPR